MGRPSHLHLAERMSEHFGTSFFFFFVFARS
jgi:hypothetical protein